MSGQSLRVVPLGDRRYPLLEALVLRHPTAARDLWLANRPWREGEVDEFVRQLGGLPELGPLERGWVRMLAAEEESGAGGRPVAYHNEVSARYEGTFATDHASFDPAFVQPTFEEARGTPEHRGVVQHDFALQFRDRFAIGWRYVVDTNIRSDPTRRTRLGIRGKEAAFEVLDAYATASAGPLRATVGRLEAALGPGRTTSPFVSESIPALDQIRVELIADPIRFTGLIAQLSRERPNRRLDPQGDTIVGSVPAEDDPVPFDVTRFLYLHRLDWRIAEALQVAISEAALVSGVDRGVEFRFANPFIPFFATQEEDDETDQENVNVVINVEAVYSPPGGRLYGDLFVQEFFIDKAKRDSIGNQLAWRVGGWWADPFGWRGGSMGAEYTRVDVFTYLHRGLNTNWTTFDVPLGSSLGPDGDHLLAWADYWLTPAIQLRADILGRRRGERSVATLESVIGAGKPEFPSGTEQRELRLGLEAWGFVPDWGIEGRVRIESRRAERIGNEPGRDGDFHRFAVQLTYRWNAD